MNKVVLFFLVLVANNCNAKTLLDMYPNSSNSPKLKITSTSNSSFHKATILDRRNNVISKTLLIPSSVGVAKFTMNCNRQGVAQQNILAVALPAKNNVGGQASMAWLAVADNFNGGRFIRIDPSQVWCQ